MPETFTMKGPYGYSQFVGSWEFAVYADDSTMIAKTGNKIAAAKIVAALDAYEAEPAASTSADTIETAMALWEAVLDVRGNQDAPLLAAFERNGFAEMRRMSAALIPAADAAWKQIANDYGDAWDWEFLPIVVSLWIEAGFDASAVTVEKIVAAATGKEE